MTSSSAPAGVSATRYSSVLTSLATPTLTGATIAPPAHYGRRVASDGHADAGLGRASPIFPVRDLAAAEAFYARLGFRTRRHDDGYGYAERDALRLHLRRSPELDPFANPTSVYVDTADPDALHAEWLPLGFWLMQVITPELAAEARERWARGEPVGRMNERVEDKPWRIREFALLDLDNNQLRFGRPV